jgi:putative flippase GtrA
MTDPRPEGPPPTRPGWGGAAGTAWETHRDTVVRLARYSAVSAVATTTSLVTLGILVGGVGLAAAWSNLVATAVGTVPSFELNRRWVWRSSRRSLFRQVVPFCLLSMLGLVISTVAVSVAAHLSGSWDRIDHTVAVESASVAAYGTLWVIQYQLLDRVLFPSRSEAASGDVGGLTGEMGRGEGPDRSGSGSLEPVPGPDSDQPVPVPT